MSLADEEFFQESGCSVCGGPASITIFEVANTFTGLVEYGAASQFSQIDRAGNPNGKVRHGYLIRRGHGFCGDCYTGRHKHRSQPATQEIRRAWLWAIGFHGHGAFPRRDATDDEVERYSDLVNRQAKAHENPEAIDAKIWREDIWGMDRETAIKRYVRPTDTMAGIRAVTGGIAA